MFVYEDVFTWWLYTGSNIHVKPEIDIGYVSPHYLIL